MRGESGGSGAGTGIKYPEKYRIDQGKKAAICGWLLLMLYRAQSGGCIQRQRYKNHCMGQ